MGISNAAKGAYYKARTKKWLQARGYQVFDLEMVRWIWRPGGERIPVKFDQAGSDLLAMNAEELVFVQVKGGAQAAGGTFPAARREFAKFTFPPFVKLRVIGWVPRAREPRVVDGRS